MDEQRRIKEATGRDVYVREFEDIKKSDRVNSAGRASYVERNYWMVDGSVFVIITINEGKKWAKSGTKLACDYAIKKRDIQVIELMY